MCFVTAYRQAAVGWPLSELWDRQIASYLSLDPMLESGDRVPSLLNGGLEQVSPVWWGFCLGLTAAIDLYGLSKAREGNPSYFPGNLQFDPLGLYPADKDGRERMETAEIKHGRLAMMAVVGYAVQEYVTKLGVVDETPFFF
jgi:Chlorophyll A-B binding protein